MNVTQLLVAVLLRLVRMESCLFAVAKVPICTRNDLTRPGRPSSPLLGNICDHAKEGTCKTLQVTYLP